MNEFEIERNHRPMITRDQAQALATLACELRPARAPKWDPAGVFAILANVRHLDLGEVTQAVVSAARNPALKTPGAIGNPASEVWRAQPAQADRPSPYDPNSTCGVCGKSRYHCERNPHGDHVFESQADAIANRVPHPPADAPAPVEDDPLMTYLDRRGA